MRGLQNDIYCQIGLVMLVGLGQRQRRLEGGAGFLRLTQFVPRGDHEGVDVLARVAQLERVDPSPGIVATAANLEAQHPAAARAQQDGTGRVEPLELVVAPGPANLRSGIGGELRIRVR